MWYERNVMYSVYVIKSCDLSVLAMPLMGFQKKKKLDRWVGGLSSIQIIFGFFEFF